MMDAHHQEWTDRLSEYLSDDLDPATRARLDAHLSECLPCREVLAGLREVVALAYRVEVLQPPRDLWPAIAAGMASAEGSGTGRDAVIALPTARRRPAGMVLSRAALSAAAAVLVLVSAGTTWWVATSRMGSATVALPGIEQPLGVAATAGDLGIPEDLAAQLGVLEGILATARTTLEPETVAVLERNLLTIESAIEDSRLALSTDPGNTFLLEHLQRMYRRKLVYLQDAVRVAEWTS